MIIHLNGWPGVGKKTIGEIVAARLGARFIHNHLLHDVAIQLTGLQDPGRWTLYEQVRRAAYDALAARPASEIFVMTNALAATRPREVEAWGHVVDLAVRRSASLVPIVLELEQREHIRRLQSTDRVGRKLSDEAVLRAAMANDTIQKPDVPELGVIDVGGLSAQDAASQVIRHVDDLRRQGRLTPVS